MRVIQNIQMSLDEIDISNVAIDINSRDDIPKILIGLKHIYMNVPLREKIFRLIEDELITGSNRFNGRPRAISLWRAFVMGTLRVGLNIDWDRLHNLVNRHIDVRRILGKYDIWDEETFNIKNIMSSVSLFTPELIKKINTLIVNDGLSLEKNTKSGPEKCRIDSFVLETNVHYPSDINLLFDAMRVILRETADLGSSNGLTEWRQYGHNIRQVKKSYFNVTNRRAISRNARAEEKKKLRNEEVKTSTVSYLDLCKDLLNKAKNTVKTVLHLNSKKDPELNPEEGIIEKSYDETSNENIGRGNGSDILIFEENNQLNQRDGPGMESCEAKLESQEIINSAKDAVIDVKCNQKKISGDNESIVSKIREEEQIKLIEEFIGHAERQIDQTYRRVILGEIIPHDEKVFSLFQKHTEWVSKGKLGKPVEFGVRVGVSTEPSGFILNFTVMQNETDDKIAVPFLRETKELFPTLLSCSFDQGFHSKSNQVELAKIVETVGMHRKGKLTEEAKKIENSDEFREARRGHSAVESNIHGLEVHGLDICLDHGIEGFSRYAAFGVVGYNIHHLGSIIRKRELKKEARRRRRMDKLDKKAA